VERQVIPFRGVDLRVEVETTNGMEFISVRVQCKFTTHSRATSRTCTIVDGELILVRAPTEDELKAVRDVFWQGVEGYSVNFLPPSTIRMWRKL
jgi:hypothetical protein